MPDPANVVGTPKGHGSRSEPESAYAWSRLGAALLLSSIGGVGMWSVIVALPALQAEFGVARSAASLPYTVTMICFGLGSIAMGRLSDRFGIIVPVVGGTVVLGLGYARTDTRVAMIAAVSSSPSRTKTTRDDPSPRYMK